MSVSCEIWQWKLRFYLLTYSIESWKYVELFYILLRWTFYIDLLHFIFNKCGPSAWRNLKSKSLFLQNKTFYPVHKEKKIKIFCCNVVSIITVIMLITVIHSDRLIQTNNLPFLGTNHILSLFKDLEHYSVVEGMIMSLYY